MKLSPLMEAVLSAMRRGTIYEDDLAGVVRRNYTPNAPHPSVSTFDALERRGLVRRLTPRSDGVSRPHWELSDAGAALADKLLENAGVAP